MQKTVFDETINELTCVEKKGGRKRSKKNKKYRRNRRKTRR